MTNPGHNERMDRIEANIKPPEELPDRRGERISIDALLDHFLIPGCSVTVIADGELVASRGYGETATGSGNPVTPRTLFQACSISKAVAGVGAMRMVQAGQLDLDADINAYLSSWEVPANGAWQPRVSLRQLLTHTAGLRYNWFPGYRRGTPTPTALQTVNGAPPANTPPVRVVGVPGAEFRYSGAHYAVLQLLMEDVSGEPFPELMERLVLEPLGLQDSSYDQAFPTTHPDGVAHGHNPGGVEIIGGWMVQPEYAGAGLWTTPSALCRLAIEVQQAWQGASTTLLDQPHTAEMLTPGPGQRGLGWVLRTDDDQLWFEHSGGNVGYRCHLLADAHHGRGAAVMTNSEAGWPAIAAIFEAIADEYGWPDAARLADPAPFRAPQPAATNPDEATLSSYAGVYQLETGLRCVIEAGPHGLLLRAGDQPPMTLTPVSIAAFRAEADNVVITFDRDEDGSANRLHFQQFGDEITGARLT